MSTTCIVQARTGSTRLPGKVLADLGGVTMLRFLLDRLSCLHVDDLVVATSDRSQDDAVADVSAEANVPVVRGPEEDVLSRFMMAIDEYPARDIVRITADCPLTDPEIIHAVAGRHRATGADYTSNVLPRTFPKGLDVEIARADALRVAAAEALDPSEREHVMPFLYRRPARFHLANLRHDGRLGGENWSVDTQADLDFVREIVNAVGSTRFGWQEALRVAPRRNEKPTGQILLRPADEADERLLLELRNDDDAVRFSGTGRPVSTAEHHDWFVRRLDDPATRMWVAERSGQAVGTVRIEVSDGWGTLSIALERTQRGHGLGRELLRALIEELTGEQQVTHLTALVHPANAISARLFEGCGFRRDGYERRFLCYRRPV